MGNGLSLISTVDPLDEVGIICARLNAAHADLISLVGVLVTQQSWAIRGIRSVEHWLTCYAGVSPATARDLVRVATRSVELLAMGREVAAGRLSLGQAAVVAAHTPAGYDADVVELAVHATVPQLRRALVKYDFTPQGCAASDGPAAALDLLSAAAQPAELSMYFEKDRFHLRYSAPADIGALVQQALVEAKDALFLATQGPAASTSDSDRDAAADQPRPRQVRLADAMAQLATRSLDVGTKGVASRAGKFRIYLHLNTAGQGWFQKAGALPGHLLRKWTCDGVLQPIWETQGTPVNVGRSQRIVPDRTRRLVEDRDRGCAYPGCLTIHHVECHHIVHWADGGVTDMDNLISLCPHHHDRHHTGDFSIHPIPGKPGKPGRFEFHTRNGSPIGPVTARPSLTTEMPAVENRHGPDDDRDGVAPQEPPRYVGPTNEVLHLDWVRFHHRPAHPITDTGSDDEPHAPEPDLPA